MDLHLNLSSVIVLATVCHRGDGLVSETDIPWEPFNLLKYFYISYEIETMFSMEDASICLNNPIYVKWDIQFPVLPLLTYLCAGHYCG